MPLTPLRAGGCTPAPPVVRCRFPPHGLVVSNLFSPTLELFSGLLCWHSTCRWFLIIFFAI